MSCTLFLVILVFAPVALVIYLVSFSLWLLLAPIVLFVAMMWHCMGEVHPSNDMIALVVASMGEDRDAAESTAFVVECEGL